jgi:Phage terminase large subunit gpA, ATPase domain/Terminase large subunit gpA, endonuclease domain
MPLRGKGYAQPSSRRERVREAERGDEGLKPRVALYGALAEYRGDVAYVPLLEWSMRVPEAKSGTLNFRQFPFQPAIYEAMGSSTREVVVRKGTQLGISACVVRWAIYEADRNGNTVLYVFPTETHVHDFSDARVTPMVDGSDYLDERRGDPFNKGLKRFGGRGLVYFRGAENKRALDAVDADGLALDEYDTLNQKNIPDAERRLSGPLSKGLIRRVGVPSLPQFGIGEQYDLSDRRKWLVQCGCGHLSDDAETHDALVTPRGRGWQELDFWRSIDQERGIVVCAGCAEPLDVAKGRWVAQNPSSGVIGFHVWRALVPNTRLTELVAASRKTAPYEVEAFINKDLGRPYAAKEARLTPEDLAAATRDYFLVPGYAGPNPVTAGVDVASERALNVRISELLPEGQKRALFIGEAQSFDELALLLERYQVNMAVVDHLPETRLARKVAEMRPGRVYLCSYASQQQMDVLKLDEEQRRVSVRRVEAIDYAVEQVRRQKNELPVNVPEGYVAHLTAVIRRVEVDELNRVTVRWIATRPDDYLQAEVYDCVAEAVWAIRQQLDEAQREHFTTLDEHLEFSRSNVTDLEDLEYRPGPAEPPEPGWGSEPMYGVDPEDDRAY